MCIDRLEAGEMPICVLACSARALDFGPLSEMQERYGKSRDLEDLPNSKITMQPRLCLNRTLPKSRRSFLTTQREHWN
jgi:anaerobic dimethyl sulfoxide reductase subunit B (iron-sulfur subunit)